MELYDILYKLWSFDAQTCPCEMGIPCPYGTEEEPCGEEEIDCISAILTCVK